jgi:hypothetical protein
MRTSAIGRVACLGLLVGGAAWGSARTDTVRRDGSLKLTPHSPNINVILLALGGVNGWNSVAQAAATTTVRGGRRMSTGAAADGIEFISASTESLTSENV